MMHPARDFLQREFDKARDDGEIVAKFRAVSPPDYGGLVPSAEDYPAHLPIVGLWNACCIFFGVNFEHELASQYRIKIGWEHAPEPLNKKLKQLLELYQIAQDAAELSLLVVSKSQKVQKRAFFNWASEQFPHALATTNSVSTVAVPLNRRPPNGGEIRKLRVLEIIEKDLDLDPQRIPYEEGVAGAKRLARNKALENRDLFTHSNFKDAWEELFKEGRMTYYPRPMRAPQK